MLGGAGRGGGVWLAEGLLGHMADGKSLVDQAIDQRRQRVSKFLKAINGFGGHLAAKDTVLVGRDDLVTLHVRPVQGIASAVPIAGLQPDEKRIGAVEVIEAARAE